MNDDVIWYDDMKNFAFNIIEWFYIYIRFNFIIDVYSSAINIYNKLYNLVIVNPFQFI